MKGQTKKFGIDEGQMEQVTKAANSDFCPDASHVWCVFHILNLVVGMLCFLRDKPPAMVLYATTRWVGAYYELKSLLPYKEALEFLNALLEIF